jgi:hypothetical protein
MSSKRATYGSVGCIDAVWNKAKKVKDKDPKKIRIDPYKNEIKYEDYGKKSKFGWKIDHIKPKDKGGSDDIINLQALGSKVKAQKGGTLVKKSRHSVRNK